MKSKQLLALTLTAALFLSTCTNAFAAGAVSASDWGNADVVTVQSASPSDIDPEDNPVVSPSDVFPSDIDPEDNPVVSPSDVSPSDINPEDNPVVSPSDVSPSDIDPVTLDSLEVRHVPDKTTYYVGERLDPSGMELIAHFSDGSEQAVADFDSISPMLLDTVGRQAITVVYGNVTATFEVNVIERVVASVAVKSTPYRTTYEVGDTLDTAGLVLTVTYEDGFSEDITEGFDCEPTVFDAIGSHEITVSYKGKSDTFYAVSKITLKILSQPEDVTVPIGGKAEFAVTAQGQGMLSYQWYYRKAGVAVWSRWNGHTDAATWAEANSSWNGMQVYCTVTDDTGNTVSSTPATIILDIVPLQILEQPQDVTANVGDRVSFTVKAKGEGSLSYQWYYRKAGVQAWTYWNGHTSATTSANANITWNGIQLYCVVKDSLGNTVSSQPATVTLNIKPLQILEQPQDVTVNVGGKVNVAVKAQGEGNLSYQWYYRKAGVQTWTYWNGHNSAATSANANITWNGIQLYCIVKDSLGNTVSSQPATVTLDITPLKIIEQPQDVLVPVGGKATFTVKAQGEGVKYQWYYRKAGVQTWTYWNGHYSATTSANANLTWNGIQLYCVVTDSFGNTVSSQPATVTLDITPLKITEQPKDVLVPIGGKATFTVKAQGENVRYQWYTKKAGADGWKLWSGHTSATTSANANVTWDGIQLYCAVTDAFGSTVSSQPATVTLDVIPLAIAEQPQDVTAKVDAGATVALKAEGQKLTYQWYYRKAGIDAWTLWNNHTSASTAINTSLAWDGSQYYCVIKDVLGKTVSSDVVTLTLQKDTLSITKQPADVTVKIGEKAVFSLEAQGVGLTYQWYYRKAGVDVWTKWNDHVAATTSATANKTWNGLQAYCIVTDYLGNTVSSEPATVILDFVPLAITAQPEDTTVNLGDNVSFTVEAQGESLTYQWYYRQAGTTNWNKWWWWWRWDSLLNGTNKTVIATTDNLNWEGMQAYCLITDTFGNTVSTEPVTVSLNVIALKVTAQPEDVTVDVNEKVSFTVGAEGNGLAYQWYYRKAGESSWRAWSGHNTATTDAVANATWHGMQVYCKVTDILGNAVSSQTATISINIENATPLKLLNQSLDVITNYSSKVYFSVKAQGESLNYQWYYRDSQENGWQKWDYWFDYSYGTTDNVSATADGTWNGRQVYCLIKDGFGNTIASEPVTVTINVTPLRIIKNPQDVTADINAKVVFTAAAEGDGLSYQWYFRKAGNSEWKLWNDHIGPNTAAQTNTTWNGLQVYCEVKDAYGNTTVSLPATVTLNVTPLKIFYQPQDTTANVGGVASFTVKAQGDGLTYQWFCKKSGEEEWSVWSNQTTATPSATTDITWNNMQVYCVVTDFVGNTVSSSVATVTLNFTQLRIITQPKDTSANVGGNVSFSVLAQGEGIGYQWYFKKADDEDWTLWEGHTGSTTAATADESWNDMQVRCVVTDVLGNTITSDAATITMM